MFLSCSFGTEFCFPHNFTWVFHNIYGNCFTFNDGLNGDIENITIPGSRFGLQLEIFLGEPKLQTNDGIMVFVHNQSTSVHVLSHGVMVPTNMETNMCIKRSFLKRLPRPHGMCVLDLGRISTFHSPIFDYIVHYLNATYTQQLCFDFCMQIIIQTSCNCSNAEMPQMPRICLDDQSISCMFYTLSNLNQQTIDSKCMQECLLECNTVFYDTTFSMATYPFTYNKALLLGNPKVSSTGVKTNNVQKSVLKLNFFYENLL